MAVFTKEDAAEAGRKGGLANGRKKFAMMDKVIGRVLKTSFTPNDNVAAIFEQAEIPRGEKVQCLTGIITMLSIMAFNGNIPAATLLFDLYGVTPNAREKLAKAAAVDKLADNPEGVKLKDIAPVTPEQMKAEAVALGIYGP